MSGIRRDRKYTLVRDSKDIAYSLVGGTVHDDWSTLCTKCDKFFREAADTISDDTAVAVALAYPNYDTPTTGVDVTKGD